MIDNQYNQPSAVLKIANHSLLILMLILGAGILLIGYFWLISPKIVAIDLQKSQIISSQEKQEQNKAFLASLKKLEQEFEQIKAQRSTDLARLSKMIPVDPQIAELFSLSEKLAVANGFVVNSIDFSGDFEGTAGAKPTKAEGAEPQPDSGLRQVIIHLIVQRAAPVEGDNASSYEMFKKYLDVLETNLRLMDITTVSFDALVEGLGEPSAEIFNFDIITYYKQNE